LQIAPLFPAARLELGQTLQIQGHFVEALASLALGHELGSRLPGWNEPSAEWLRLAEKQVERSLQLDGVLKGEVKPANPAERVEFAQVAKSKKRFVAAVRLYEKAFAEEPALVEDKKKGHRYDAACYAARAAAGEGDGAPLDAEERGRLRRLALEWLRADLAAKAKRLDGAPPEARAEVRQSVQHWKRDLDLDGLREPAAAGLSARERQECGKLWAEVESLLRRAGEQPR
jgi:hypothetical protein